MKRIFLLIATNIAVMAVLSITAHVLGVNRYLAANGMHFGTLLAFAALMGFGGAFLSLLMSKSLAKWSTGAQVVTGNEDNTTRWLVESVYRLASAAGIEMPEVAIYDGSPNAFATGASQANSLVAVSTGLLQSMTRQEVEAVLAHEIAHIANGDMVTLTLVQGCVNTFTVFLARVVGYLVDSALQKGESRGPGIAYSVTVLVCDLLFGILGSMVVMYFSRQREYRADAGAAYLLGSPRPMIAALARLGGMETAPLPQNMAASGIAGVSSWTELLASHPSLESRIEALQAGYSA